MADHPTFLARELANEAERDFSALQRRRSEVDAKLAKFSDREREEFKSELQRLLKRNQIAGAKPSFRRSWSNGK